MCGLVVGILSISHIHYIPRLLPLKYFFKTFASHTNDITNYQQPIINISPSDAGQNTQDNAINNHYVRSINLWKISFFSSFWKFFRLEISLNRLNDIKGIFKIKKKNYILAFVGKICDLNKTILEATKIEKKFLLIF